MLRLLLPLLLASTAMADATGDLRQLARKVFEGLQSSGKRAANYGFTRRVERREFDANGKQTSQQVTLFRRDLQDGFMVTRPVERDGKPLPEAERRKNEEAIQKRLAEFKAMTPEQRAKLASQPSEEDAWLREFPEALDYKLVGEETIEGRPTLVIECSPRPGYRPSNMRARVFEKMRGRIWVDKAEQQLAKADVEVFDTVNVGWGILGKIEKGTRFYIEHHRVAPNVWLNSGQTIRFAARVMLVKNMHQEIKSRWYDFRHREELAAAGNQ